MNVALPAELEKRVNESVERGDFASQDEFLQRAVELLLNLRHGDGSPIRVDENWDNRVEALIEEAHTSGEATEMTAHDWEEVERQGFALIEARKKA